MNISALLAGARSIASHPASKGGALASLITGGLCAATVAGIVIPPVAMTLGPIAGYILYFLLPKKIEDQIDETLKNITDAVTVIPQTYPEYPDTPKTPISSGPANGNYNK